MKSVLKKGTNLLLFHIKTTALFSPQKKKPPGFSKIQVGTATFNYQLRCLLSRTPYFCISFKSRM